MLNYQVLAALSQVHCKGLANSPAAARYQYYLVTHMGAPDPS